MDFNDWLLTFTETKPTSESTREALCTVGNGVFATRGAWPEKSADGIHYPGTYAAGVYNRLGSHIADRWVENESLVNLPNWLGFRFKIDNADWLDDTNSQFENHVMELDMHRGVVTRRYGVKDSVGRHLQVSQRWFMSLHDPHLASLSTTFCPKNFSGQITTEAFIDAGVQNTGVARYRSLPSQHLTVENTYQDNVTTAVLASTNQSNINVAVAQKLSACLSGHSVAVSAQNRFDADNCMRSVASFGVAQGQELSVDKLVSLYTSKDYAITEPLTDAISKLAESKLVESKTTAGTTLFDQNLKAHVTAWRHVWERIGITLGTGTEPTRLLHLHTYHIMSTVSAHSALLDCGIPARGLHGEAYRGHIFWDELFIFPFFSLQAPELTRALLLYRYRRLGQARLIAAQQGVKGAMFPWQSSSNGREETQTMHLNPKSNRWLPDASHRQRHVSGAIAYNVWTYYQATGDEDFMRFYGAEMMVEIARMWASLATYNHLDDRWEILGVMGPDEYHESYPHTAAPGLNNNTYTNILAVWCINKALGLLSSSSDMMSRQLREKLDVGTEEIDLWEAVSSKMKVCFHNIKEGPVISQFEGWDDLLEFDWEGYREKYGDISRLDRILEAENDSTNCYKLAKQADVLMLLYLFNTSELQEIFNSLGYEFDDALVDRTVDYYELRTSHGSTLSRVVHSWVNARRDRSRSYQEFLNALHSDVDDIQGGTTGEGIHTGAMAGTLDLVQRCYTGLQLREEELQLNPRIPVELGSLHMTFQYRGRDVTLFVSPDKALLSLAPSNLKPICVRYCGSLTEVAPGDSVEFDLTR